MPHTNRKKKSGKSSNNTESNSKKFVHSKRELIDSEDGWTHVADKGWRSAISKSKSFNGATPLTDMTLDEMVEEHERFKRKWESSHACAELKEILLTHGKSGRCKVTNLVCLALGTLQALSGEWRGTSHTQLAALTTIRENLELSRQTIVQDPRFTELDKQFLISTGCEVVNDPEAFLRINESSLVYAIHCPLRLFSNIRQQTPPAMIVGNDVRNDILNTPRSASSLQKSPAAKLEDTIGRESPELEEESKSQLPYLDALQLVENCEEIDFPQLRYDFSSTKIYWRYS